jgi:hypothetical protein
MSERLKQEMARIENLPLYMFSREEKDQMISQLVRRHNEITHLEEKKEKKTAKEEVEGLLKRVRRMQKEIRKLQKEEEQ